MIRLRFRTAPSLCRKSLIYSLKRILGIRNLHICIICCREYRSCIRNSGSIFAVIEIKECIDSFLYHIVISYCRADTQWSRRNLHGTCLAVVRIIKCRSPPKANLVADLLIKFCGIPGTGIHRDGILLEDYAAADTPLRPEEAQRIGETRQFEAEKPSGDVLKLKTDAGSVLLHLRSGGEKP